MSNNGGLSRDALIEKVAGPIDDQYDDYSPRYNAAGVCVSSGLAVVAVDVVLSAVADDLERESRQRGAGRVSAIRFGESDGLRQAAERVRGLLGKDATSE